MPRLTYQFSQRATFRGPPLFKHKATDRVLLYPISLYRTRDCGRTHEEISIFIEIIIKVGFRPSLLVSVRTIPGHESSGEPGQVFIQQEVYYVHSSDARPHQKISKCTGRTSHHQTPLYRRRCPTLTARDLRPYRPPFQLSTPTLHTLLACAPHVGPKSTQALSDPGTPRGPTRRASRVADSDSYSGRPARDPL